MKNYGATGGNTSNYDVEEHQKSNNAAGFNEDSLRFLPAGKWSSLSRQEKNRKLLLLGVPIVIAIAIVGAAAYFLTRDFGDLYPGHGNSNPSWHTVANPAPAPASETSSETSADESTDLTYNNCALFSKCSKLEGLCCPTSQGIMLECCK